MTTAEKCPSPSTVDPIVAALDEIKTSLTADEKAAQEKTASKDALKQDLTALQDAVKQLDGTVEEYEKAYKKIVTDRATSRAESAALTETAAAKLSAPDKANLDEDIKRENREFQKVAGEIAQLWASYDTQRETYEKALREFEKAQRNFERLRSYLRYVQAGVAKLTGYNGGIKQAMSQGRMAAAYVLGNVAEETYKDPYYLPATSAPAKAEQAASNHDPKTPTQLRAELRTAWLELNGKRTALRAAKIPFETTKASIKEAEKTLEDARERRDQDLLKEAAEVDRNRSQGGGAAGQPARKPVVVSNEE